MIDLEQFGRFWRNLFSPNSQTESILEVYISEQNFEYIFRGSEHNFTFEKACYEYTNCTIKYHHSQSWKKKTTEISPNAFYKKIASNEKRKNLI